MLVSCLAYSLTLKMKKISSSEMLVDFWRTTQRFIPEDTTLHLKFGFQHLRMIKDVPELVFKKNF
jgi:hypothetical protein